MQKRCAPAASAAARVLEDLLGLHHRVHRRLGLGEARLRAEAAVLGAAAGLGVDQRAHVGAVAEALLRAPARRARPAPRSRRGPRARRAARASSRVMSGGMARKRRPRAGRRRYAPTPVAADPGTGVRRLRGLQGACLRYTLQEDPGIEVVGEAADGMAAIQAAERLQPDVVLLRPHDADRSTAWTPSRPCSSAAARRAVVALSGLGRRAHGAGRARSGRARLRGEEPTTSRP